MSEFEWEEPEWLKPFGLSVWHEYSGLARSYGSVNLGQGFPGWSPESFVVESLSQAIHGRTPNLTPDNAKLVHQYARPNGHLRLVHALKRLYEPLLHNQTLNAETDFQITVGASGGLFATLLAILSPGDEVIVLAPWFDIYAGGIARAGATMVELPLKQREGATSSADYYLDCQELEQAITGKTKAIIINTPHNPTGKVFTFDELSEIADVIKKHPRLITIMDEVYEWIIYDNREMARMCTVPGMWGRTINISSAAKTFSVTGWKIGWVYGPSVLINAVARCHQFAVFSVSTPMQEALAVIIEALASPSPPPFLKELKEMYSKKRKILVDTLREVGLNALAPEGTYFVVVDISKIEMLPSWGTDPEKSITGLHFDRKDWNFCRWLTTEHKLTAIPCSAFYSDACAATDTVRFAYCKSDDELEKARTILLSLKPFFQNKM